MAEYNGEVLFKQPKAAPAGSAAPNIVPIANGVDTTAAYAEEAKVAQDKLMADAEKARVESARILPTNWEGILNSPQAAVTGAAALSVLGTGLYQLYGQDKKPGIKDRLLSNQTPIDRTIDIPLDSTQVAKNFPAALSSTPNPLDIYAQQKHGFSLADIEANSGGAPLTKTTDIDIVANSMKNGRGISVNPLPGTVSNKPAGIPGSVSPMNQLTGGATPPAPLPPPSISNTVATGGNVTKAVTQNIANDLDVLTKKEQGMKNWLLNQYGGKNEPMAHEAYNQVKNILGYTPAYPEGSKGGSLAPEEKGKILQYRKQELPGPKVNLTHDMKKALKAGGPIAAALIATTEFANAKTPEEKANAGANMLGAILPLGADIRDVGAPTLPSQQIPNAALLGSPYAQTEWAKTQRLREKAGAGRGIAPPSAYFR